MPFNENDSYSRKKRAKGHRDNNKILIHVRFPRELFEEISKEAESRGWSFAKMVVHLCEASIDGIE